MVTFRSIRSSQGQSLRWKPVVVNTMHHSRTLITSYLDLPSRLLLGIHHFSILNNNGISLRPTARLRNNPANLLRELALRICHEQLDLPTN